MSTVWALEAAGGAFAGRQVIRPLLASRAPADGDKGVPAELPGGGEGIVGSRPSEPYHVFACELCVQKHGLSMHVGPGDWLS